MRKDAIQLEETRLHGINGVEEYPDFHERHRIFPALFENRQHRRILDIAAGVGYAAQRVHEKYPTDLLCNDISPTCLRNLKKLGLSTVSFDLDDPEQAFPFPEGHFDAIIAMAIIEHIFHIDHFMKEIHRTLSAGGYLYMMTPNYGAIAYLARLLLTGRTFHNSLSTSSAERYEFYAHIRYFTYRSLIEFVSSFGFVQDTVYLAVPEASSRYRSLSGHKARVYRYTRMLMYNLLSPRWAASPIVCFQKASSKGNRNFRKVVL